MEEPNSSVGVSRWPIGPPRWTIPKQIWGLDTQHVSASKKMTRLFIPKTLLQLGRNKQKQRWAGLSSDKYRNFPPPFAQLTFSRSNLEKCASYKGYSVDKKYGQVFFTVWNFQVRTKSEEHQSEKTPKTRMQNLLFFLFSLFCLKKQNEKKKRLLLMI